MSVFNPADFNRVSGDVNLQYLQSYYYTKTSSNNLLSSKLPLSGGTISGNVTCATGGLSMGNTGASLGAVFSDRLYISDSTSSASALVSCPTGLSSYNLILPPAQSTSSTSSKLMNNGSGALSWVSGNCLYLASTAQTISNNAITKVQFPTAQSNIGSIITATNSNSRYTNTSAQTVFVYVSYCFRFNTNLSVGTYLRGWIQKNGGGPFYGQQSMTTGAGTIATRSGAGILKLASNDFFEIFAYHNSGAGVQISANNNTGVSSLIIWQLG